MEDFSSISLLSLAMLVGCYVAGIIPLAVNFSEVRSTLSRLTTGGGSSPLVLLYSLLTPCVAPLNGPGCAGEAEAGDRPGGRAAVRNRAGRHHSRGRPRTL